MGDDTVLPAGAWAVIWDPDKGYSLLIPRNPPDEIEEAAIALTAVMIRLNDDLLFRSEMADWFKENTRN